jgi:hypothetical protein
MNPNLSWHKLTLNPKVIESIYSVVPRLEKVAFMQIHFSRDASMISFVLDLPLIPQNPPIRWVKNGFNTVQLKLNCIEVEFVELNGWGHNIIGNLEIIKTNDSIHLQSVSNLFSIKLVCKFVDIAEISAYVVNTIN